MTRVRHDGSMKPLDEIATTLERFPEVLAALFTSVDESVLRNRPAPDEWCPLEVVGHLIDCDGPSFRDRIGAIIAGVEPIPAHDITVAIDTRDFALQPVRVLLDELRGERASSAAYLRGLDPADLAVEGRFGDERRFSAGDFVHEWPFHDQDHLQQILGATKLAYLPHMTDAMRQALAS